MRSFCKNVNAVNFICIFGEMSQTRYLRHYQCKYTLQDTIFQGQGLQKKLKAKAASASTDNVLIESYSQVHVPSIVANLIPVRTAICKFYNN